MLNVLSVVDKQDTAIDRLAQGLKPYMLNLDYNVIAIHPKRPSQAELDTFIQLAHMADVIDYQYFRTAEMLRSRFDWLRHKPSLLTHHNPYSITESDWNSYQMVIGINQSITRDLRNISQTQVGYIQHAIDFDFFRFNEDYQAPRTVNMVANRIESSKGILQVAQACQKINAKMFLIGNISDNEYFKQVIDTGVVMFGQNVPNTELRDIYYRSGIHVCNSKDNFESGTLPILEAIACGVPVLTRNIGHVPDWDENNVTINSNAPEDVDHIAGLLQSMFGDKKRLEEQRQDAWFAIKHFNNERRGYMYQRVYRELLGGQPVSIVMPIADREELTAKSLHAIAQQDHKNIELIICDDGSQFQAETIRNFARTVNFPISYYQIGGDGYNLAKSRNIAIAQATGDIIVFCDQRMVMEENAISQFLLQCKPRTWLYGDKGAKKDFVENFSCINRSDIMDLGGFNERITQYGGITQEIRSRARHLGFDLKYVSEARATAAGKSSNRRRKKYEIMASKNLLYKMGLQ